MMIQNMCDAVACLLLQNFLMKNGIFTCDINRTGEICECEYCARVYHRIYYANCELSPERLDAFDVDELTVELEEFLNEQNGALGDYTYHLFKLSITQSPASAKAYLNIEIFI